MKAALSCIIIIVIISARVFAFENAPDIQEVQKAALDYARIRPDELSDMKKRARLKAILPKFQAGVKRSLQNDIDISINDNVSISSSGVSVGPETSNLNQSSDSDTNIEVKAVWSLDELIFNRDVLDIAEEARYQIRERRQILSEVNKLYFAWAELRDKGAKPEEKYRSQELSADLDALTGGWFSRRIDE